MHKEVYETWAASARDLYVLLNLRLRQEVLGRRLLPVELMHFALFIQENVNEVEEEEATGLTFAELERSLSAGLEIFTPDIERLKREERNSGL